MIDIRPATVDDAATLAELRWEFRTGRAAPAEDRAAFVERCATWMRAELSDDGSWRCWVAVDGARIVGHIWVRTIPKIPNPVGDLEHHAYVSNFYIRPESRGGTGTRLLRVVLDWAAAASVDSIVLWPTPRSRPLYERHGFSDRVDLLALKLSPAHD